MKYKDKDGKVFEVNCKKCGTSPEACPLVWVDDGCQNPAEAARLMGYAVVDAANDR